MYSIDELPMEADQSTPDTPAALMAFDLGVLEEAMFGNTAIHQCEDLVATVTVREDGLPILHYRDSA